MIPIKKNTNWENLITKTISFKKGNNLSHGVLKNEIKNIFLNLLISKRSINLLIRKIMKTILTHNFRLKNKKEMNRNFTPINSLVNRIILLEVSKKVRNHLKHLKIS